MSGNSNSCKQVRDMSGTFVKNRKVKGFNHFRSKLLNFFLFFYSNLVLRFLMLVICKVFVPHYFRAICTNFIQDFLNYSPENMKKSGKNHFRKTVATIKIYIHIFFKSIFPDMMLNIFIFLKNLEKIKIKSMTN